MKNNHNFIGKHNYTVYYLTEIEKIRANLTKVRVY